MYEDERIFKYYRKGTKSFKKVWEPKLGKNVSRNHTDKDPQQAEKVKFIQSAVVCLL